MKTVIPKLLISTLLLAAVAIGSYLHSFHLVVFNSPLGNLHAVPEIANFLNQNSSSWRVIHILAGPCACSNQLVEYFTQRGPAANVAEVVLAIDPSRDQRSQILKAGFQFIATTHSILKTHQFDVSGIPLMYIFDSKGNQVYVGGYTKEGSIRKTSHFMDLEILEKFKLGQSTAGLFIQGCSVSKGLSKQLDPLGLKYMSSNSSDLGD